jgi:hypothetical protein
MMTKSLEIGELINQIKEELTAYNSPSSIFFVDEISLEIQFTIEGDIGSGFNLGVVTLNSDVNEQRVQKINIKLVPTISKDQMLTSMSKEEKEAIAEAATKTLFKGSRAKG